MRNAVAGDQDNNVKNWITCYVPALAGTDQRSLTTMGVLRGIGSKRPFDRVAVDALLADREALKALLADLLRDREFDINRYRRLATGFRPLRRYKRARRSNVYRASRGMI